MEFWQTVGKIAEKAVDSVQKEAERRDNEIEKAMKRGQKLSDKALYDRFKKASGYEKAGYAQELRNRGYGSGN